MSSPICNVENWQTWKVVGAVDTFPSSYKASGFVKADAVSVHGKTHAMIRCFGKGADGDTAVLRIIGYMADGNGRSVGPGQLLYTGTIILGTHVIDAPPTNDKKWIETGITSSGSGNWTEVDVYPAANGTNAPGVTLDGAAYTTISTVASVRLASPQQAILILATLGYYYLSAYITGLDAGGQMTDLGILYRAYTNQGSIFGINTLSV